MDNTNEQYDQMNRVSKNIPKWTRHGKTVLLPKGEDFSNEKDYVPIT